MLINRSELLNLAKQEVAFHGLDLERVSTVFLMQIFQIRERGEISIYSILDEVKNHEGIQSGSATKSPNQFKYPPLEGLWKVHFNDAAFLLQNIAAHFDLHNEGNSRLDHVVTEALNKNKSGCEDQKSAFHLSHEIGVGAYERRAKKGTLTGEWIIFQKNAGKNYYLTIGVHGDDDAIYQRVLNAYEMDFKFLGRLV